MRWLKTHMLLLVPFFLPLATFSAHALEVTFCVPSCAAPQYIRTAPTDFGIFTPPQTVDGVTTTFIDIASDGNNAVGPFTITATVTAEQSGTIQQIIFNPTTIATDSATSGCTTDATNPCRLEIIARSDPADFPGTRPAGGYPAGVFMAGFFSGTQAADGDTISMTGATSALSSINAARNTEVINVTPGGGAGDTPVSLPSSCTGTDVQTCKFIASEASSGFYDTIEETVQHTCDAGQIECPTQMVTRVNVEIKTAGNILDLPLGTKRARNTVNGTVAIVQAQGSSSLNPLTVAKLAVGSNDFAVAGTFIRADAATFDPVAEEVYLRVGPFAIVIPRHSFQRQRGGGLYTFLGKVGDLQVAASLVRSGAKKWAFAFGVHGFHLNLDPVLQTDVHLSIGDDSGFGLGTPIDLTSF